MLCTYGKQNLQISYWVKDSSGETIASGSFSQDQAAAHGGIFNYLKHELGSARGLNIDDVEFINLDFCLPSRNVVLPRGRKRRTSSRNLEIIEKHKGGLSMRALAAEYGLSFQRIQQIVSRGKE